MADSPLMNIASLLLSNLDMTSIMKSMLGKMNLGQSGGSTGTSATPPSAASQGQGAPVSASTAPAQVSQPQAPQPTSSFGMNPFASPMSMLSPQSMGSNDFFSQMMGSMSQFQGPAIGQFGSPNYYNGFGQGNAYPYPGPQGYGYNAPYYIPPEDEQ